MNNNLINIVLVKRNLRLHDNKVLEQAAENSLPVLLLYVFDELDRLNERQSSFVYDLIQKINLQLIQVNSSVLVKSGNTLQVLSSLCDVFKVENVFVGEEYETDKLALNTDLQTLCRRRNINFHSIKDHVIFSPGEILKKDGTPYTIFTAFKNKWLENYSLPRISNDFVINYVHLDAEFPTKEQLSIKSKDLKVKNYSLDALANYEISRDYPSSDGGSYLGPYLRFGALSVREIVQIADVKSQVFLSELIWREFFMHILYFFPYSQNSCFKKKYEFIHWRNNEKEFELWSKGETGVPIVDAGMHELVQTGYMHNRVRMIAASFLCKHLLIDWRWGEAFFASQLLDYEVSSNVGNWQWVAGTGCDAAPYFRIFNPVTQQKKFDRDNIYVNKWIKNYCEELYFAPIVDLKEARQRALTAYKKGIEKSL